MLNNSDASPHLSLSGTVASNDQKIRRWAPWLVLTLCVAISDRALSKLEATPRTHPSTWARSAVDMPSARYQPAAVASCLERARALVQEHATVFSVMSSALHRPSGASRDCAPMSADAPFAAFEGWWKGRWNDIEVAHLWLTIEPGVQLVVLSDDGVVSLGVNLIGDEDEVCGLVVAPDGEERLHQGRFFAATAESPAYLKWLTPDRNYYERVTCSKGERNYEILEEIVDGEQTRWGTIARYKPAESAPAVMTMWAGSPRP